MELETDLGGPANPDGGLIKRLGEAVDAAIGSALGPVGSYALLDFPDHSNVGDSAIWLGELAWLEAQGMRQPAYVCTVENYDPDDLRRLLPSGPILIHGGGNFGDLWPRHQSLRERICMDFPDRAIFQLPQSVHFDSPARAAQARSIFSAHPDVTIFARDHQSLLRLRDFGCRVILCPDMALCLGEIVVDMTPNYYISTVLRSDKESSLDGWSRQILNGIYSCDWLEEEVAAVNTLRTYIEEREGRFQSYRRIAEYRLARGLALLSRAHSIVTDRLHGHLLCMLLGRPNLVLDNSYGKLGAFRQCWTSSSKLTSGASGPEELSTWLHAEELRIVRASCRG